MTERREYTAQDIEQVNKAEQELRARGLDESNERIVGIIDGHYQANRVPVRAEVVTALIEAQSGLKWASAAELEYRKIAAENPQAAQQIWDWLANQKLLVNTGDEGFRNASNLLQELRGREINSKTIHEAIGRIQAPASRFDTRKRPPLHYVQAARREMGTITEASRNDDGSPFLGRDMVKNPDGSYRSKTPQEQRRDMEVAERAKSSQQTPVLDASEQSWKNMADGLLHDGTHSQQARVRAVYDREQGNGWRRVYEACQREVNAYKNRGTR